MPIQHVDGTRTWRRRDRRQARNPSPDLQPILRELDDDALYDKVAAAVREKEQEFQAKFRAKGWRIMGPRKIGKQSWKRAAVSF